MASALGRPLRSALRRHEPELFLVIAGGLLVTTSLAPLAILLLREAFGWLEAESPLANPALLTLLLRSLVLSALTTVLALIAGLPLGVLVGRTDAWGRWPAALLHAFPMFLPPFVIGLGWFHVFGASGMLGSEATSRALFGPAGLVLVLALTFAPIVTSLVALGVQGVDASLEEAGRVVAGPARVAARILLPAAAPAWILAAIVTFALSFSELGVPMFLRVDTYPAAVFSRLAGIAYAPGEALALVLPLLPLALAVLAAERRFVATRSFAVLGLRSGREDRLPLGHWRGLASAALWIASLVSVAPIAALAWRAVSGGALSGISRWMGHAAWNSLSTSAAAATAIVAIGLVVGHAAARRLRGAAALDAAAVLAFVAPAPVLGVGLIALWNRPALQWLYGSAAMLVAGCVARYAVVGVRTIGVLVAQTPLHLEEAAAVAGAGYWQRLTRVLLPLHARGVACAWLLAFVFCLRDLELSVLYYPAGGEPLTVRLFTLEANGPEPVVAALGVVQAAITAAALAIGGVLLVRRAG